MSSNPTDRQLDDLLYRRDVAEEYRQTWLEETHSCAGCGAEFVEDTCPECGIQARENYHPDEERADAQD